MAGRGGLWGALDGRRDSRRNVAGREIDDRRHIPRTRQHQIGQIDALPLDDRGLARTHLFQTFLDALLGLDATLFDGVRELVLGDVMTGVAIALGRADQAPIAIGDPNLRAVRRIAGDLNGLAMVIHQFATEIDPPLNDDLTPATDALFTRQ